VEQTAREPRSGAIRKPGTAEEVAEKVESLTSAAKADGNRVLIAALKRCATQNQTFSAACEAVRLPKPDFFCSL